ncbi:nitroreductase [Dactylosporangium vinaceum]|uniref:Acg family FMN-binding oxidoreductase n=1 Tax=Dactylosporangium vinaceum TaxID=53362 RepID=A0ABV5MS59_9ACTN|nr:nitroreductase family protein [Dactylosporangium vinaceum]UAC00241.1 nitroreductase [Dactylosporangium vinaceum]
MTTATDALAAAADAARLAPSVHNTQPWRWVVDGDRMELFAVPERQLAEQDPDGRLMVLSCGAALHHALVALAAAGWKASVTRDAGEPLAVIQAVAHEPADPHDMHRLQLLQVRRTDRRVVTDEPVAPAALEALAAAARRGGARLHVLNRDQVLQLAVMIEHSGEAQRHDAKMQAETAQWAGGSRPDGTGIPAVSLPAETPLTTVAERDFGVAGALAAGGGHDSAANYAILYGEGDERSDWLAAGEALGELWLVATGRGTAVLPLSSPVELDFTRVALRRMLGDVGWPYLVLRLGIADPEHAGPPHTPRLPASAVVSVLPGSGNRAV